MLIAVHVNAYCSACECECECEYAASVALDSLFPLALAFTCTAVAAAYQCAVASIAECVLALVAAF